MVVNLYKEHYDIYIGREGSNLNNFGNPWSHRPSKFKDIIFVPTREIALDNFKKWIYGEDFLSIFPEKRKWILSNLYKLKGQILGCFCKPKACHGDILEDLLTYLNI